MRVVACVWFTAKTIDLPMSPFGSRCASRRNASHMTRLRCGVKIFRSRSWILKFSSCSLMTTAPACFSKRLGRDVRAAVNNLGQAEKRPLRVLNGVDDVVAERRLARLAAEIVISVAQLPGLKRLWVFCAELLHV